MILWVLFGTKNFSFEDPKNLHDRIENITTEFVFCCLDKWPYADGKGLSDFILEKMAEDFLDKRDFKRYRQLMQSI